MYVHIYTNHTPSRKLCIIQTIVVRLHCKNDDAGASEASGGPLSHTCSYASRCWQIHNKLPTCTYARRHARNSPSAAIHTCTHINMQAHACIHKDIQIKAPHIYMLSHFLRASRSFVSTGSCWPVLDTFCALYSHSFYI